MRLDDRHIVFVYGTLKRDHANHRLLANASATSCLGKAITTSKEYVMFEVYDGAFPIVCPLTEGYSFSHIHGEVYAVDDQTLFRLDQLEGHPTWYRREKTTFRLENGDLCSAWVYLQQLSDVKGTINQTGEYRTNE